MNAFDKVIGYEGVKNELLQICDMLHNRKTYEDMGARLPQGILLYGDPGLGKTLLAKCFIEESGLQTYTVRRNKGDDDFIGDLTATFALAKVNAPAIVFLDDMDKFANEDRDHRDAEEYVAVQSGIDEVKGSDVFVLATANDVWKLPGSLTRSGRFDRKLEIQSPGEQDARAIIAHYLSGKRISERVDLEDLAKMISYSSCAELETILNEAAVSAAFARKQSIEMDDFVRAVLRMQYEAPDDLMKKSDEDRRKIALHEAGHLVVSEALCPGSVGLASLRSTGRDSTGGFIHRCKKLPRRQDQILVSLAGKAAVEMYDCASAAEGCQSDIERAFNLIRDMHSENCSHGFGMIDVATPPFSHTSENMNCRSEAVTHAELERYMLQTRDILLKNRDFLEKAAQALLDRETLLHSDICALKRGVAVTPCAVA